MSGEDRERLLSEILAEPGDALGGNEERGAVLDRMLLLVKRKRRIRQIRRAGTVLLLAMLPIALVIWRFPVSQPSLTVAKSKPPCALVRTTPLSPSACVATRPMTASELVASAPSLKVASISTRLEERGYQQIDDSALLALTGTNAAVLVRLGPHSAELVFASGQP